MVFVGGRVGGGKGIGGRNGGGEERRWMVVLGETEVWLVSGLRAEGMELARFE